MTTRKITEIGDYRKRFFGIGYADKIRNGKTTGSGRDLRAAGGEPPVAALRVFELSLLPGRPEVDDVIGEANPAARDGWEETGGATDPFRPIAAR